MKQLQYIFLIVLFLLPAAFAQKQSSAKIKFVIGDVQRLPAKQTSWLKAKINGRVYQGDRIKTASNSRVEIEMPDGSKLRIDQSTIFDIKEIKTKDEDGEDKMSFSLWAGNIWAKFKKVVSGRQSRRIESPSAVVAIRGTELEVNVNQQLTTKVSVTEGLVAVSSKDADGQVLVGANQQTTVQKGQAPTEPTQSTGQNQQTTPSDFVLQVDKIPAQQTDPAVLGSGIQISGRTVAGARVMAAGVPINVAPNGQFSGKVTIREGFNNIRVAAEKDGKSAVETVRLFVNTRRPQIQLSSPLVSGFLNKRNYSLSGAVFDETPLDKIKVFFNGDEVAEVRGRGTFNRTVILHEGRNDIKIAAIDLSKNSVEMAERIFLDTVKPIITITEPAQTNFFRLEPPPPPDRINNARGERFLQIIRGVIIDPQPSSQLKRILINGKEIQPNTDGSFQTEIYLVRGENPLQIYAEDLAGNITRDNTRRIIIR
ncbi:MAG: hypothetical protein D8M58_12860 [Calditrichaeota bacterium]|nr:MAG: hypothetical protein DWQ03_13645 [Calditrichota bacterium]MBL1206289.1 hypothetical protein [Calditrichota bacterium]NOG46115.1 FecR domain-containing protein [Calditrichota bacterium]